MLLVKTSKNTHRIYIASSLARSRAQRRREGLYLGENTRGGAHKEGMPEVEENTPCPMSLAEH